MMVVGTATDGITGFGHAPCRIGGSHFASTIRRLARAATAEINNQQLLKTVASSAFLLDDDV